MKASLFVIVSSLIILTSCGHRANPSPTQLIPSATMPTSIVQQVPGSDARLTFRRVVDPAGTIAPFWISETEVTWDAYDPFAQRLDLPPERRASEEADPGPDSITRPTPPYSPPDRGWGHYGFAALGITFHGASQYCIWLSNATGKRYRLPTVAEWRLACGATPPDVTAAAWCEENADEKPHAVARKMPNAFELYDMLGNVAEWSTDGPAGKPVVCGGSFVSSAAMLSRDLTEKQTPAWQQSQPNYPKSKWWLSDAPFVGFRMIQTGN